jgi:hypothetical protein
MLGTFHKSTPLHKWAERELALKKLLDKPGYFAIDPHIRKTFFSIDAYEWSSLMSIVDAAT